MKIIFASNASGITLVYRIELEEAGYIVYQAHSIEVIKCLIKSAKPDIVIIAFLLPFVDDYSEIEQTIIEIKKVDNRFPILLLTVDSQILKYVDTIVQNVEVMLDINYSFEELFTVLETISNSKSINYDQNNQHDDIHIKIRDDVISYDDYLKNIDRFIYIENTKKNFFTWVAFFIETTSNILDSPSDQTTKKAISDIEYLMSILPDSYSNTYLRVSDRRQEFAHYLKYKSEQITSKIFQCKNNENSELRESLKFDLEIMRKNPLIN